MPLSELVQARCEEAKDWSAFGTLQDIADLLKDLVPDLHRAVKKNSQMCKDTLLMLFKLSGRPERLQHSEVVVWGDTRLVSSVDPN